MKRLRAANDEDRCEQEWLRPKVGKVRCVYLRGHLGDHQAPTLPVKGKRPVNIDAVGRLRNEFIRVVKQTIFLIQQAHKNRDAILLATATKHLVRLEADDAVDLQRRRGELGRHLSSDGCWIDGPPGPECGCQSCRQAAVPLETAESIRRDGMRQDAEAELRDDARRLEEMDPDEPDDPRSGQFERRDEW